MQVDAIRALVARLDSRGEREKDEAWLELRSLGADVVPHLRAAYPGFTHGEGRVALVYHAIRYARVSEDAFQLGLAGLGDRSKVVRYRACALLAYSLRKDAIEPLRRMRDDPDWQVRQSARAAEFAIQEKNHHLFVDRRGAGATAWQVNPGDGEGRQAGLLADAIAHEKGDRRASGVSGRGGRPTVTPPSATSPHWTRAARGATTAP